MTKPLISIITPVHVNSALKAQWINELYNSLNSQSFNDWEWIVIDDASPVYFELSLSDKRVRRFHTPNKQGPGLIRNTAVGLARAEAILPLDADDLLHNESSLMVLYKAWKLDTKKFVYGDLQRYAEDESGNFIKGKVFNIPQYEFEKSLDLKGTIPVTALHSKDCHYGAGGWKKDFDYGLEDVEYWISAGLAGFCGYKVPEIVLLYRKHNQSRTQTLRDLSQESAMRNKIKEYHKKVYEGEYPMGCCGSRPAKNEGTFSSPSASFNNTSLLKYPAEDIIWVRYNGKRQGTFGVKGSFTKTNYQINGMNYEFPIHKKDSMVFSRLGRGKDFTVGITSKMEIKKEPSKEVYKAPEPELGVIDSLDEIAKEVGTKSEPPKQEFRPIKIESNTLDFSSIHFDLTPLDLGEKVQKILEDESWTIESLSESEVSDLLPYKGIGAKTALEVINSAKDYLAKKIS